MFSRTTPLVMREYAWEHPSFEALPEFRKHRFAGVSSIPLLESGQVIGLLNVCRSEPSPLKPREFSFLLSLGVPVGALLTMWTARQDLEREVEKLTQQLADRKVMERAKGLIQARFAWTEEEAYFCLRNLSRRRRAPMRAIAEEVILTGASEISVQEATQ
jgi:signal transduction protein with GAF and PtsI domain